MYGDFTPWYSGHSWWSDFEPACWRDWLLIPWWLLRYLVTWAVWRAALVIDRWAWRPVQRWLWARGVFPRWRRYVPLRPALAGNGRHTDLIPVMCPLCLWAGPVCALVHTYHACGEEDVEPVDECPRCGLDL